MTKYLGYPPKIQLQLFEMVFSFLCKEIQSKMYPIVETRFQNTPVNTYCRLSPHNSLCKLVFAIMFFLNLYSKDIYA